MESTSERVSGTRRRPIEVLVVEVDAGTQLQLAMLLQDHGCFVRFVDSQAAAEEALLDDVIPDVVLSALEPQPGRTTHALAERLRRDPRTRHVGRVALVDRAGWLRDTRGAFEASVQNNPLDVPSLLELIDQLAVIGRALRRASA